MDFFVEKGIVNSAFLRNEFFAEIENPESIIEELKKKRIPADLFVFSQRLPDTSPKFDYHMEWDNIAAIPISTYETWFTKQIHPNTRNKIRKAEKLGIAVQIEDFNKRLVNGLVDIFNETPVRRGKRYSYYGWDEKAVKAEWARELDYSIFLVAYHEREIIGFIKLVYCRQFARTSGTVAKISHRNKAPMNALFSKAVEICAEKKIPYLIYGKYTYGKKGEDSLTSFKKVNGFNQIDIPRYFIPITLRGRLGLKLGLQHGLFYLFPNRLQNRLFSLRSTWHQKMAAE